jgi:hypothetical protein
LPPSDVRFRKDIRLWENYDDDAELEKDKLETLQSARLDEAKSKLLEENPFLTPEEPDLYTPVFFDKTVETDPETDEKEYWYKPKGNLYW